MLGVVGVAQADGMTSAIELGGLSGWRRPLNCWGFNERKRVFLGRSLDGCFACLS